MGTHWSLRPENRDYVRRSEAAIRGAMTRAENKKRMALADKITMAIVDEIANAIIRPGPKPEERECYVMAQELREHGKSLAGLVAAILKIEDEEGEAE